jgi:hypothetical protein
MAVGMVVVEGPSGMTQHCDLVIRGGRVVTGDADSLADVGILGESIAQIGGTKRARRAGTRFWSNCAPSH